MQRFQHFALAAVIGLVAAAGWTIPAAAQTAQDAVGTWSLVSLVQEVTSAEPFGPHPHGVLMLGADGRFSVVIVRAGLPRFAANNREKGTAEENQAVLKGSIGYFGTYKVNTADKTLEFHILASTFPNWEGTDQKRALTIEGDNLVWINASPSAGGNRGFVTWKRVK